MRDDMLAVTSTVPSPPGSRIEGRLPSGGHVRLKVHVVRKEEAAGASVFRLEGRLIDLTREVRKELAVLAEKATPASR
jgi:hypothetical protein